jgi:hypothetical protein
MEWHELFSDEEREVAQKRLTEYRYPLFQAFAYKENTLPAIYLQYQGGICTINLRRN